jgi:hypothetical protein
MKTFFFITTFILLCLELLSQSPTIQWQRCIGGTYSEKVKSIQQTSDGGFIMGGYSDSFDIDLSNNYGLWDFFIVKTNQSGDLQWKVSMGGNGEDLIQSIIQASDSSYLAVGSTHSTTNDIVFNYGHIDYWAMKIAQNGSVIWKKTLGGTSNDLAYGICEAENGNFMIVGSSESNDSYVLNNHGQNDVWLVKIDTNGNILWQNTYGGTASDFGNSIKKTADNGYIIAGYSNSVDGDLTINKGGHDAWAFKINSSGTIEWQTTFGGTEDDFFQQIIQCSDGSFVAVGETYSYDFDASENHFSVTNFDKRDYFVVKIDSLGNKIWSRCYGGSLNEYARKVIESFDGDFIINGESYSPAGDGQVTNHFGSADCWLVKVRATNGDIVWEHNYGGSDHDDGATLTMTFDNKIVFANQVYSTDGDITTINHRGNEDIWLVKLIPQDCPQHLNLTQNIITGNAEFKASTKIQLSNKILDENALIQTKSNGSILLLPKFETKSGSTFSATIGNGCSN